MKKTELYNQLSDKLIKSTILKPGQSVTYRLSGIEKSALDPTRLNIPSSKNVPPVDHFRVATRPGVLRHRDLPGVRPSFKQPDQKNRDENKGLLLPGNRLRAYF